MIVCDWGHWRLLVWPYFAHFTKKWGETPKKNGTRENSGISGRSKPVGFLGGLLGWGTTSQGNLAFPYAMVTMVIQSLVCQCHWMHCKPTDMDNSPTKFWRKPPTVGVENLFKKSVSIIKFEKRSALLVQFLYSFGPLEKEMNFGNPGCFWGSVFVGGVPPRRLKSASFTRLSRAFAPQIARWHGNLKMAWNAGEQKDHN